MVQTHKRVIIYTDGGSRGNPGPAAAAYVLTDENKKQIQAKAFFLGKASNNVAEYTGLAKALDACKDMNVSEVEVFSDSELMVRQINGQYKVKSPDLKPLYDKVMSLLEQFDGFKVHHVRRENNKKADDLVNQALDQKRDVEAKISRSLPKSKPARIAALISGGGRTVLNIQDYINRGELHAEVGLVISSLSNVAGVERAKKAGLDVKVIRKKDHPDIDQFSKEIEKQLKAAEIDLIIQAGWLCLWKIPKAYEYKVMNIHPALLPSFGGQGMWGHHVHEAVLEAGCKVSGCTVHFCTDEYDKGPIIVQRCCEVKETDNPNTLAARVFEQECIAYPQAISLFIEKRLTVKNNRVRIK